MTPCMSNLTFLFSLFFFLLSSSIICCITFVSSNWLELALHVLSLVMKSKRPALLRELLHAGIERYAALRDADAGHVAQRTSSFVMMLVENVMADLGPSFLSDIKEV